MTPPSGLSRQRSPLTSTRLTPATNSSLVLLRRSPTGLNSNRTARSRPLRPLGTAGPIYQEHPQSLSKSLPPAGPRYAGAPRSPPATHLPSQNIPAADERDEGKYGGEPSDDGNGDGDDGDDGDDGEDGDDSEDGNDGDDDDDSEAGEEGDAGKGGDDKCVEKEGGDAPDGARGQQKKKQRRPDDDGRAGDPDDGGGPGDGWNPDDDTDEADDDQAYGSLKPAVFSAAWLKAQAVRFLDGDTLVIPNSTRTIAAFRVRDANHRAALAARHVSTGRREEADRVYQNAAFAQDRVNGLAHILFGFLANLPPALKDALSYEWHHAYALFEIQTINYQTMLDMSGFRAYYRDPRHTRLRNIRSWQKKPPRFY